MTADLETEIGRLEGNRYPAMLDGDMAMLVGGVGMA